MDIKFITDYEEFYNDYMDIVRAFYPLIKTSENGSELSLRLEKIDDLSFKCIIEYDGKISLSEFSLEKAFLEEESSTYYSIKYNAQLKRHAKVALYDFLSKLTGAELPYGSLTGIRPTKLYHEVKAKGLDADGYFRDKLRVTPQKLKLISSIVENQAEFYSVADDEIDVFVNIPICVSRCAYCSFISAQLDKIKKSVVPYCDLLVDELDCVAKIIKSQNLKVRSVYVGGGTPTSLDDANFERVIKACAFDCKEFTVEAGRPDTITKEKLDIMARYGVNRISVNPQTFNQKTLDVIGRSHSVDDIYKVYKMAREYDFDINMDLIAMLPSESFDDFKYSVDCAIALNPDNITVHTLALKKGSTLKVDGYDNSEWKEASSMVDYAYKSISLAGYSPYYMYKQKYVSGNLENVGYCKKGKACIYNIDIMEEISSIIAVGAGGISKRIFSNNRLERLANPKGIDVYLQRKEKLINDKIKFFEQCSNQ
ncbi:MAG: coproporphyrinogen dehydrogenase HemZ [Clostridia bacterium]|nr:coproporphyrinogen dehydrogenase HemZ [Clostridia bacterium]MDE7328758.1 coproporphyrinogen dehydrogenase HemZ [Clostridia bacterium]